MSSSHERASTPPPTPLTGKRRAPYADRLARRLRQWHAQEGDPLPIARCQHVVAVLHGHAGWMALQAAAAARGEPDAYRPEVGRLKQFGYPPVAAERLVAWLASMPATIETSGAEDDAAD